MNGIFYKITYKGYTYIGELSSSTDPQLDFLKFHIKPAEPWKSERGSSSKEVVRWENTLQKELNRNGLKQEIENFSAMGSISFDSGVNYIINSMQNFLNSHKDCRIYRNGNEWYNDVLSSFGINAQDKETRVPEMLLILLESKNGVLWNTHANYGPRGNYINNNSYKQIINTSVLKRREKALAGKIELWFSYDPQKTGEIILDAIGKKLYESGFIAINVNNAKNRQKLMPHVNHAIAPETIERLRSQIDYYIDSLEKNIDPEQRNIAEVLTNIKRDLVGDETHKGKFEPQGQGRKQLKTFLTEFDKQINSKINKKFFYTAPDLLEQKVYWLRLWLEETSAPSYQSISSPTFNWYKQDFTNYIQKTYLNRPEIPEYQGWKEEWIETRQSTHPLRPGALYPTFLKQQNSESLIDNNSLKQKIYSKINNNEEFIRNNWDNIYPEQIAYLLTQKHCNFNLSDNIETYDGFIDTIELNEINCY